MSSKIELKLQGEKCPVCNNIINIYCQNDSHADQIYRAMNNFMHRRALYYDRISPIKLFKKCFWISFGIMVFWMILEAITKKPLTLLEMMTFTCLYGASYIAAIVTMFVMDKIHQRRMLKKEIENLTKCGDPLEQV